MFAHIYANENKRISHFLLGSHFCRALIASDELPCNFFMWAYSLYQEKQYNAVDDHPDENAPSVSPVVVKFLFFLFLLVLGTTLYFVFTATAHMGSDKQIFQSAFIIGIAFVVCIFNLMQFSLKLHNIQPFLVSILCLLLVMRESEKSPAFELLGIPFSADAQVNFLLMCMSAFVLVIYYYKYLDKILSRKVVLLVCFILAVYSVLVLLAPIKGFNEILASFLIFMLFCIAYCFYGLYIAIERKQKGVLLLMLASAVLFASVINDILYMMSAVDTILLSSFGLVFFLSCHTYASYRSHIYMSEKNAVLREVLRNKNGQLEELSNSLEQKINFRTSALAAAKEKLETLANQDPLTGLANRRYLMAELLSAERTLTINQQSFCVAMIDFDNFKQINDTLGHDQGDFALKEGARLMQSTLRDTDVLGRWGGEEFLLLANNTDLAGAEAIAIKLKQIIHQELPKQLNTPVSVTIGIAKCGVSESVDECLKRADEALYEGKRTGRNRIVVAKATK